MSQSLAELSGVSKRFGKIEALNNFELQVRPAELLAVLGPNGAGKSTAIALMLGLQQPDSGSVRLFGGSPMNVATRRQIGVMMQDAGLAPEVRVREHVDLVASYYADPLSAEEALTLTGTSPLSARPYGKLSGGQKRQVQFAMAIVGRPKLLFLDEPAVGLDIRARELMWAAVRELVHQGVSIVLTTHYLEEAESLADRVVVLAKGRAIASGTVDELRSLVDRRHISCVSSFSADLISTWPGVQAVNRDRGRLQITATNADTVVKQLVLANADFRELEVHRAGLAEAFTELTQEVAS